MIRVCSVCILRIKFNVDLSFSEMRMLCQIQFKNASTQREKKRKDQEELHRVHQINLENSKLLRQILVEYFW